MLEKIKDRFRKRTPEEQLAIQEKRQAIIAEGEAKYNQYILGPGRVEQLMSEARTPTETGGIHTNNDESKIFYQVPPEGYDPEEIVHHYYSNACIIFVKKDGSQIPALTFALTNEEAQLVEERISAEKNRLGLE